MFYFCVLDLGRSCAQKLREILRRERSSSAWSVKYILKQCLAQPGISYIMYSYLSNRSRYLQLVKFLYFKYLHFIASFSLPRAKRPIEIVLNLFMLREVSQDSGWWREYGLYGPTLYSIWMQCEIGLIMQISYMMPRDCGCRQAEGLKETCIM